MVQDDETLAGMLRRNAGVRGGAPAILAGDASVSHEALAEAALRLAGRLADLGLTPGQRLAVYARKTPEAVIAFLAAAAAGGVFFPLDPNQPPDVTRAILDRLAPAVLVVAAEYLPALAALYPEGAPMPTVVCDGTAPAGKPALAELAAGPMPAALPRVGPHDPVYLNFTSGTTGAPKGAVTTLGNLLANTRAAIDAFALTPDDVHLCMMPVFVHPHETLLRPLALGGTMVLCDRVSSRAVAEACSRHQVTALMAVAAIYETVLRLPAGADNPLATVRVAESGGMHVPSALAVGLRQRFGASILPVWGSTETTGVALANRPGDAYAPCCLGRPVPGYDVAVVREDGSPCAPGEPGELVISGPGVCPAYFGEEPRPEFRLYGGRFRTGDEVFHDEDERFFFAGRQSMLLKVGGMKVFPVEIEEALRQHPDVAEAVVIPVADALRGEAAKAVVAPKNGASLSPGELRRFLSGRLHRLKMPRVIEIRDALPRTPGGKIAWRALVSDSPTP
ncbi:MAG: acyl-CoA synthetase (AMP-forming)/AMP-acid ligase II [Solidesulfovibrio magneticus str. Maddingley MBC34]|uniref:Acyl-CoA synthetase (AMP-forming)/AMP-acid ligase II n=1 Tax=Solidesulfovibrio magneticus str. Maddingley MBC34 TaxID=1206767 RepID=K6GI12_9BACT|nr:MAG: acyl-CoA synthetase (AMP-forming)/AMP-acid ligase II [Solidesulfovibrio magneticus str. Maddingley MBC34]